MNKRLKIVYRQGTSNIAFFKNTRKNLKLNLVLESKGLYWVHFVFSFVTGSSPSASSSRSKAGDWSCQYHERRQSEEGCWREGMQNKDTTWRIAQVGCLVTRWLALLENAVQQVPYNKTDTALISALCPFSYYLTLSKTALGVAIERVALCSTAICLSRCHWTYL